MEFSCYKDDLNAALKAVMPAVAVNPQSPVLSGIYINAEGNTIELQSNNFTKGVIVKSPCSVEQSGEEETEYNTVKLNFYHNTIELFANSGENGSAEQIITADVDGEDLGIAFNYRYLTDVLRLVDAPNINIAFNDHFNPALVTVPGNDNFLYVVTPVRT